MSENWNIQMLRVDFRPTQEQTREVILRPLARIIARRLMAEGLADQEKTGQTISTAALFLLALKSKN
jgi:hypothetical protein